MILILAMLLALVGKATSAVPVCELRRERSNVRCSECGDQSDSGRAADRLKKRAVRAIWWGVAAAAVASIATAIALNVLIVSAPGAAREMLEGLGDAGGGGRALLRQLLADLAI